MPHPPRHPRRRPGPILRSQGPSWMPPHPPGVTPGSTRGPWRHWHGLEVGSRRRGRDDIGAGLAFGVLSRLRGTSRDQKSLRRSDFPEKAMRPSAEWRRDRRSRWRGEEHPLNAGQGPLPTHRVTPAKAGAHPETDLPWLDAALPTNRHPAPVQPSRGDSGHHPWDDPRDQRTTCADCVQ